MGRAHTRKPECNDDSATDALPATSGDDDSGLPKCKVYNEGEQVLARHSSRFYEAKVEKVKFHEKDWSYYIHYRVSIVVHLCFEFLRLFSLQQCGFGFVVFAFLADSVATFLRSDLILFWLIDVYFVGLEETKNLSVQGLGPPSWDEWVGADRLLEINEENLLTKMLLDDQHNAEKNARHVRAVPNNGKNGASGKKQKNHPADSQDKRRKKHSIDKGKDIALREKLVNITIPLTLKKQLMDDHEFIVHLGKLFKLPRTPNVVEILKKYHDYRKKKDGVISETVREILSGLRDYFDKALPVMLLYDKERQQYRNAVAENLSPADVYGAEHLLRLFVKMPALLFELNIEEEASTQLQQNLNDFLKFLQKNQGALFSSIYHTAKESENSSQKDGG